MNILIPHSLEKLKRYIEAENFKGYDPYDTLNSKIKFSKYGKWIPVLATQVQKRNPINIRNFIGITKDFNPKAMGLFLYAYSILYENDNQSHYKEKMDFLFNWLYKNFSRGYTGYAWGYNFPWSSPAKNLDAFVPSIVVTSFIGKGIFKYFEVAKDPRAIQILRSSCQFILNDLHATKDNKSLCFSYTPILKDCCYNANMLGAELLARVYSITKEDELLEYATKAVDFTIARQHDDGHWNYSINITTRKERKQIDFHQGYILESLNEFMKHTEINEKIYLESLKLGAEYYQKEQFFKDGRSKWRIPKKWPIDIHNQSQGILTFSKLRDLYPNYLRFATTIANWTITNMQDKRGHFYYQKHKLYVNKIPYMRWSQAWMMLALATLISSQKK